MISTILFVGKLLLIAFLYLFLFTVMRTGIGLVKGQRAKSGGWTLVIERGPKELKGLKLPASGPIVIGRSPGADIVINDSFVSGRHARFALLGDELTIEDLGSTNGTLLDGHTVASTTSINSGDVVTIGNVAIKVTQA